MDPLEQLMALLGKLPEGTTDDAKNSIKGLFQTVTKEAGKAKTDLMSYKKLIQKLKDAGVDEDRYDSIAEELGVKKTLQDEVEVYKVSNKELNNKVKTMESQLKQMKLETMLMPKVKEAAQNFKTEDGKAMKVLDRFIDKKLLFENLDTDSDVLVQERVSKVVKAAAQDQVNFIKELGGDPFGTPVHKVNQGEGSFGAGKAVDMSQVRGIMEKHGSDLDAAAYALQLAEQASKQK